MTPVFSNSWLVGAAVLAAGLVPCLIVCVRERVVDRLVALQMAQVLSALILFLLAKGFHRPSFMDLALLLALLSVPSTLVFVQYVERHR